MSPSDFRPIEWRSLKENFSQKLSKEWMLITPGVPGRWNTMTASWGGFGHIWNLDAAIVFVRPSRHTYGFMEREEGFTLSFFDADGQGALELCGARSGRDIDKAKAAGLTPRAFAAAVTVAAGAAGPPQRVGFEEARLVISCRKLFAQDLDPSSFVDPSILPRHYPSGNLHRLYAGAIEGVWLRN